MAKPSDKYPIPYEHSAAYRPWYPCLADGFNQEYRTNLVKQLDSGDALLDRGQPRKEPGLLEGKPRLVLLSPDSHPHDRSPFVTTQSSAITGDPLHGNPQVRTGMAHGQPTRSTLLELIQRIYTMNDENLTPKDSVNKAFRELAAMKVEAFLQWAGISRFLFYKEVRRGRIHPKKCGSRTMIPMEEAERWLRDLPDIDTFSSPEQG